MEKAFFLKKNTIHLWCLPFKRGQDSQNLAIQVLRHYLPETEISFKKSAHGKPYLLNNPLYFNFSHAGDYFLIGIAQDVSIGVDIERVRENRDTRGIAKRFFAASEYAALEKCPQAEQSDAFYRCWTLKEAYLKATGVGLSLGLASFEVDFLNEETACLIKPHDDNLWTLRTVSLPFSEYYAAFCVSGGDKQVEFFYEKAI